MFEDYSTAMRYFDASKERFAGASASYRSGEYGSALYLAGLSIESALMAFVDEMVLGGIRAAHDLRRLADNGLALRINDAETSARLGAALTSAQLRWKNVYRYYPSDYIASLINKKSKRVGLIAPFDKSASNRLIKDAQEVGIIADRHWSNHRA